MTAQLHKVLHSAEAGLYLPTARSRLAALKAAMPGQYISNRWVIDGFTIHVWSDPSSESDGIEISGGVCELRIDSGIVETVSLTDSGALHEAGAAVAYNAPFFLPTPSSTERVHAGSTGQISGRLVAGSSFKGYVPVNETGASSFKWKYDEDGNKVTTDGTVTDKRTLSYLAPGSLFTGKCRLWVQAMHGLPAFSAAGNPIRPMTLVSGGIAQGIAVLSIEGSGGAGSATLSTNTGVILDEATGKHWMVNMGNTGGNIVSVYPLKSNACGERLRRYLIQPAPSGITPLNAEDREHLEAYILAWSRPVVASVQSLTVSGNVHAYSMGYGWHFAWSTWRADIVVNSELSGATMSSRHWSAVLSRTILDGATTWSCSINSVEGPVEWFVSTTHWLHFEPDWSTYTLARATPDLAASTAGVCNAPFYAFYLRDDLQVCRIETAFEAATETRTKSHEAITTSTPSTGFLAVDIWTVGEEDGNLRDETANEHYKVRYSVGSAYQTSWIRMNQGVSGREFNVSGKTLNVPSDVFNGGLLNYDSLPYGYPGDRSVNTTYNGGSPERWAVEAVPGTPGGGQLLQDSTSFNDYTFRYEDQTYTYTGSAVVVVPFFDAEVIYVRSLQELRTEITGKEEQRLDGGGNWLRKWRAQKPTFAMLTTLMYDWAQSTYNLIGTETVDSSTTIDTDVTTYPIDEAKMVARGGARDFAWDGYVGKIFYTLSGVQSTTPLVWSQEAGVFVGCSDEYTRPVVVGWV